MNCSEFESTLDELVDARGGQISAEAAAHRRSCPACAQLWRDHCLLDAAVKLWRPVEAPASLTDLVLRSLHDERPLLQPMRIEMEAAPRLPVRSGRWVVAATAACLAMACLFAVRNGDDERDRPMAHAPVALSNNSTTLANAAPVEVSDSVVALLADLKAEYRGLADETKATAQDFVAVLPQPVAWPNSALPGTGNEEASSQPVSEIGRSIGDQIGQAIGFLWQSVPSGDPSG